MTSVYFWFLRATFSTGSKPAGFFGKLLL